MSKVGIFLDSCRNMNPKGKQGKKKMRREWFAKSCNTFEVRSLQVLFRQQEAFRRLTTLFKKFRM